MIQSRRRRDWIINPIRSGIESAGPPVATVREKIPVLKDQMAFYLADTSPPNKKFILCALCDSVVTNLFWSGMETKKRYYRKRVDFFNLLQKMKLWPSRSGILHGIKSITITGLQAEIVTHCNEKFWVRNSKSSRAARWLRNKWYARPCGRCRVPDWKLEKYGTTFFKRGWGSSLVGDPMVEKPSKDR